MQIIVTKNEFNTLFIWIEGELIADSCTWDRKRGFSNKATKSFVMAPGFTPRKVAQDPTVVVSMLEKTGTKIPDGADIIVSL